MRTPTTMAATAPDANTANKASRRRASRQALPRSRLLLEMRACIQDSSHSVKK